MDLTRQIARILDKLISDGFQLPFISVTVSANGCVLAGQYDLSFTEDGLSFRKLCEHLPDDNLKIPINLIFIDAKGEAARVVFRKPNEEPDLRYLS